MNFVQALFAVLLTTLAALCVRSTFIRAKVAPAHFDTIDGLRRYFAFFVFTHHAAIWFSYSRTGVLANAIIESITHLGQSSIGLFFVITSFLFIII